MCFYQILTNLFFFSITVVTEDLFLLFVQENTSRSKRHSHREQPRPTSASTAIVDFSRSARECDSIAAQLHRHRICRPRNSRHSRTTGERRLRSMVAGFYRTFIPWFAALF